MGEVLEAVRERAARWDADCGVDHGISGTAWAYGRWEYATTERTCPVCGFAAPVGRLVVMVDNAWTHVACAPVPQRNASPNAIDPKWNREWRKGVKAKGDAPTHVPTPKAAAAALDKLSPATCPRFTVKSCDGASGELASALRAFEVRAAVAKDEPAAFAAKVEAKREPVAKHPAFKRPPVTVVMSDDGGYMEVPTPEVRAPRITVDQVATVAAPSADVTVTLPECVETWLAGLVFEAKRTYARALAAHLVCGTARPADPGAEWADKAEKRLVRVLAGVR